MKACLKKNVSLHHWQNGENLIPKVFCAAVGIERGVP